MSLSNIKVNMSYLPQEVNIISNELESSEDLFFREMERHFNATYFGADSMKHLFESEERKRFLVDRPKQRKKRDKKGGKERNIHKLCNTSLTQNKLPPPFTTLTQPFYIDFLLCSCTSAIPSIPLSRCLIYEQPAPI